MNLDLHCVSEPPGTGRSPLRSMIVKAGFLLILLTCVIGTSARAAETRKSIFDGQARAQLEAFPTRGMKREFLNSLTNLPPSILTNLVGVADRGEHYFDGCIGGNPRRRFILATKTGGTYNVAIEQGGFVISWFISRFVLHPEGWVMSETRIEPDNSANGSQPVRPQTNSPPPAAGSRR